MSDGAAAIDAAGPAAAAPAPPGSATKTVGSPVGVPRSQAATWYFARRFGVDHLQVRSVSSGASIEFRYRVRDALKAQALNDIHVKPYMIDWKTGAKLPVPTMEKIGALRQVAKPEVGQEYWMIFSNPGKLVQRGDRVDVVAGSFRLEGLIVE